MRMDTNRYLRLVPTLCVALALCACGSSPPVNYYSLQPLESGYSRVETEYFSVGIGPLRSPDHLTRTRFVTRGTNSEMIVHDFHRWVEPIEEAVYRIVSSNVDNLIDGAVVLAYPYPHYRGHDYRVIGRINRFDADSNGRVVLQIHWTVLNKDTDIVVRPKRSRYEHQASSASDYGSIARAMSEALQSFSRDIAAELEQVRAGSP